MFMWINENLWAADWHWQSFGKFSILRIFTVTYKYWIIPFMQDWMDDCFKYMERKMKNKKLPPRTRFMLQDIIEFRQNKVPCPYSGICNYIQLYAVANIT